jgi:hypothetical protein
MMKVLAVVKISTKLSTGKYHHYKNLLIGEYNGEYTVWQNENDGQLVLDKTKNLIEAVGTFNLWKERAFNDGERLDPYKDYPTVIKGHETTKHPFLTA